MVPGYEVTVVQSGDAAFEKAVSDPPDVIIVDLRMPVSDGLAFLGRLRRDSRLRELPVAVVTGDHFIDEPRKHALAALGATVHFKPLQVDQFVALVDSLLAGGRGA